MRPPNTTTKSCESSCAVVKPVVNRLMVCSAKPCWILPAKKYFAPSNGAGLAPCVPAFKLVVDRKSTRLNSSHTVISYAVFCLKKKKKKHYHLISRGDSSMSVSGI